MNTYRTWLNEYPDICVSGGAEGADHQWAISAAQHGHKVVVMSFNGHKALGNDPYSQLLIRLSPSELNEANYALEEANSFLKRKNWNINYLKRDFWQMRHTNSLYVVCRRQNGKYESGSVCLDGGSAWATQCFLLRYCSTHGVMNERKQVQVPMYLFDITLEEWYQGKAVFDGFTLISFDWCVMNDKPPRPKGVYTAIGAREITERGRNEMINLY
jgi:hypothetical protein